MKLGKRRVRLNIRSCSWLHPSQDSLLRQHFVPAGSATGPASEQESTLVSQELEKSHLSGNNDTTTLPHIPLCCQRPYGIFMGIFPRIPKSLYQGVWQRAFLLFIRNHSTSISIVTKRKMKKLGSERPGGFSKATGVWRNLSQFTALTTSSQPPALRSSPNTRDV